MVSDPGGGGTLCFGLGGYLPLNRFSGFTVSLFCVNRVRVHLYQNFPLVLPRVVSLLPYRALVVCGTFSKNSKTHSRKS